MHEAIHHPVSLICQSNRSRVAGRWRKKIFNWKRLYKLSLEQKGCWTDTSVTSRSKTGTRAGIYVVPDFTLSPLSSKSTKKRKLIRSPSWWCKSLQNTVTKVIQKINSAYLKLFWDWERPVFPTVTVRDRKRVSLVSYLTAGRFGSQSLFGFFKADMKMK